MHSLWRRRADYCSILPKGVEHPGSLVSLQVLEPIPCGCKGQLHTDRSSKAWEPSPSLMPQTWGQAAVPGPAALSFPSVLWPSPVQSCFYYLDKEAF